MSFQVNVLISERGKACLSDFGFFTFLEEVRNNPYIRTNVIESYPVIVLWYEPFSLESPGARKSCISVPAQSIALHLYGHMEFWNAEPRADDRTAAVQ